MEIASLTTNKQYLTATRAPELPEIFPIRYYGHQKNGCKKFGYFTHYIYLCNRKRDERIPPGQMSHAKMVR